MNIQRRPRASNVHPVNEIDGGIDDGTTASNMSTFIPTPASKVVTKAAMIFTTVSKTRVIISTNIILSQNIRLITILILDRRKIKRPKRYL